MANVSVTNTFTNGTTADADEVNANFTDIINGTSDGTKDFSISALTAAGSATLNGNCTLGNASGDDITISGSLAATIAIKTDGSFNIGSATLGLDKVYFGDGGGNTVYVTAPAIAADFIFTLPAITMTMPTADGTAGDLMITDGSGAIRFENYNDAMAMRGYGLTVAVDGSNGMDITLVGADGNGVGHKGGLYLWISITNY